MIANKFKTALMAGAFATMAAAPSTFAASGDVDVDITFPPLIILYYFSDIDIDVTADNLAQLVGDPGMADCDLSGGSTSITCIQGTAVNLTTADGITGTTASFDLGIGIDSITTDNVPETGVTFVLENSWAVRALGGGLAASIVGSSGEFSSITVSPTAPTTSLTLTDGSNIGDIQFTVADLDALTGLAASDMLTLTVVAAP